MKQKIKNLLTSGSEYTVNTSLIDYSQIEGYFDDGSITVKKSEKTAELKKQVTEKMYERLEPLKAQMLTKAKNMCSANGVEFDMSKFSTMFNNAKSFAVGSAVTGSGVKRCSNAGTIAAGSGGAAVAGVVATASTATRVIGGVSFSAWALPQSIAPFATLTIPAVG